MPRPWFVEGFGEHYLELYAHRNEREAAEAIALLAAAGVELARRRILDLGCGAGRHLQVLRRRGAWALGLDLSWPLLAEARGRLAPRLALIRGDMRRLPIADAALDGVLSMFTSFGYFARDDENWQVLAEASRVLKPGGFFLFDFLNRRQVEAHFAAHSERQGEHWIARESRHLADGRIRKTVSLRERASGRETLRYEESVRLFSPGELRGALAALGLRERRAWGDYRGGEFQEDSSPRFILLLDKEGP